MPALETLALVPFTPHVHAQVVQLHVARKMSPPQMPQMAVAATGRAGTLCASMYLYETDRFLFCEYLCTNPEYPARQRHAAVLLMGHAVVALALAKGIFVMTTPRTRGGELIARRMGFRNSGMPMWVRKADPMPLWSQGPPDLSPRPESAPEEEEEQEVDWGPNGAGPEDAEEPYPPYPEKEPVPLEAEEDSKYPCDSDEITAYKMGPICDNDPEEDDIFAEPKPKKPKKSRAPSAASGRRRGKETAGAPAPKKIPRVSRQGKRGGLG